MTLMMNFSLLENFQEKQKELCMRVRKVLKRKRSYPIKLIMWNERRLFLAS